jgi:hypothetical protein
MGFFPRQEVSFRCGYYLPEVLERIQSVTGPSQGFFSYGDPSKVFTGEVNEMGFQLMAVEGPMVMARGFAPTLVGTVKSLDEGTLIDLKIQMSSSLQAIFGLYGLIALGAFFMASLLSYAKQNYIPLIFVFLGGVVFYLFFRILFYEKSRNSIARLKHVLGKCGA